MAFIFFFCSKTKKEKIRSCLIHYTFCADYFDVFLFVCSLCFAEILEEEIKKLLQLGCKKKKQKNKKNFVCVQSHKQISMLKTNCSNNS